MRTSEAEQNEEVKQKKTSLNLPKHKMKMRTMKYSA